ncbi:MAG: hypothetical protein Q8L49_14305 [Burkholderiaceae bacterium]|nr:hypothetical protein [Burkholderiaceae bacterium]
MAFDLKPAMLAAVAGILALGLPDTAWALGAAAPFTPPRAAQQASAAADSAAAATEGLAGLRRGRLSMALIDGAWHRVGDAVRGARLAQIDAHGVLLRHADGRRERLWLVAPMATSAASGAQP